MAQSKIRVLIADDSALMRREIKRIFESDDTIEVVAAARNGKEAVDMVKRFEPDVVTLDINMPEMDGLTALQYIMSEAPRPCIMLSSLTQEGALTTYEALELGAVDFIPKPDGTVSANLGQSLERMIETVKVAAGARLRRQRGRTSPTRRPAVESSSTRLTAGATGEVPGIIVIGQSTGGPTTILEVLPLLPADLTLPVFIIQHMPGNFTPSFAKRLSDHCAFPFSQVTHGESLKSGHGYLAPGDIHCTLVRSSGLKNEFVFHLSPQPRDTVHTPSVDVSMSSALAAFGPRMIGVILTGMGADGADTMARARAQGARTIAESEETAVVYGMPREAAHRGGAEFLLPSYEIAEKISELAAGLRLSANTRRTA